jgi:hypothetical protein
MPALARGPGPVIWFDITVGFGKAMRAEHKFHSYITAATVSVMYFVITGVSPLLTHSPYLELLAKPIGSLLLSVGLYKLLASVMGSA